MKSIVAAIAALAFAVVSAQEQGIVYVTAPLDGATVTAGEPYTISWQQPTVDVITQIELRQGVSTSLQPILTIASNVDASEGSYVWDVPADIPSGNNYALVFGTNPFAYSGTFTIEGGSGASSSAAASSSPAPSSSASSSAASSSAASSSAASSSPASSSSASATGTRTQTAGDPEETDENAAAKSQPAALAALAIAGVAAVAMI